MQLYHLARERVRGVHFSNYKEPYMLLGFLKQHQLLLHHVGIPKLSDTITTKIGRLVDNLCQAERFGFDPFALGF